MRVRDKAIVLQHIRHGDKQAILKLYTRSHGLLSVIASPSRGATARIRPSALLPLTLLDVVYSLRESRELHRLSEAVCYYVHDKIGSAMAKLSIAQFINEVLIKTLKEQQPNARLFDFTEATLNFLNDTDRDYTNLHLHFIRELSGLLGFEPHNNRGGRDIYFDCREGVFSSVSLPFPLGLGENDSALFSGFLSAQPLRDGIPKKDREWLLEIWLAYFSLHIPGFGELKSVAVLKEIADAMRS